ncbi:MAG: SOS response-associated peptidase [Chloroflexi bacterium]|nr:SOS response-associated peptidase [Chloroflexota bacterium]
MCGRYSLATDVGSLEERFGFEGPDLPHQPRFNIAPSQEVLTVISDGSWKRAGLMRWGLIPSWAKDASIGNRMINARAETLAQRPAFRPALQRRRCLIVADGFYEWMRIGKSRVPMRIILKSGEPFAFAGLWERWRSPEDVWVHSCTIITTTPNEVMAPIHSRMPVVLSRDAEGVWLDTRIADIASLGHLLVPFSAAAMEAYPISSLVNSPSVDSPEVIARVD